MPNADISILDNGRDRDGAGVNSFISKPLLELRLLYLFNQIVEKEGRGEPSGQDVRTNVDLRGKWILLVEDNELNREIAEEIIGETGVTVERAENGREALEKFESSDENYYGMILMDIQMSVMNGYEASEAIRWLPRGDTAITMTANAFAEDIKRSKNAGMNEHQSRWILRS